jgi:hypothetical protein
MNSVDFVGLSGLRPKITLISHETGRGRRLRAAGDEMQPPKGSTQTVARQGRLAERPRLSPITLSDGILKVLSIRSIVPIYYEGP